MSVIFYLCVRVTFYIRVVDVATMLHVCYKKSLPVQKHILKGVYLFLKIPAPTLSDLDIVTMVTIAMTMLT